MSVLTLSENAPKYVTFLRRRCPRCQSTKLRRVSNKSETAMRHYRCQGCNWEFKAKIQ